MLRNLLNMVFSLIIALAMFNTWSLAQEDSEQKTVNIIGNVVGEEANQLKVQCPVMNTWFVPDEKTPKSIYKDKTYYFCCPGCKPQFDKDPEKYLKG